MQITKPIKGKTYAFDSRFITKEAARAAARALTTKLCHMYYTKVHEFGQEYWDVRSEVVTEQDKINIIKKIVKDNRKIADRVSMLETFGFIVKERNMGSGGLFQIRQIAGIKYIQVSSGHGRFNYAFTVIL